MELAILSQIPDEYKEIYQLHRNTIKTSIKQGRIKDVYHFPLLTTNNAEIVKNLGEVAAKYNDKMKINVAFGFIIKNKTTQQLKFFHPSNNTMLFPTPRLINSVRDYQTLVDDVEQEDAFEYARLQRPSTDWTVERIICVRFDVFKL